MDRLSEQILAWIGTWGKIAWGGIFWGSVLGTAVLALRPETSPLWAHGVSAAIGAIAGANASRRPRGAWI